MYINNEWYLCIEEWMRQWIWPNENINDFIMSEHWFRGKNIITKYKVNKEGLFEEVKD